ncbi:DinB family protein [Paenibacillus sp. TAB 01]|uniref:DinB family protein n=1 Tax=Paenibacillus sp. TAB 01 TaxID=3368988 RepID=UPI0037508A2B
MNFTMNEAMEVLERTPQALELFLSGLSEGWLQCDEGEGTWNVAEVIGHLIEGERTNWIPRLEFILREGGNQPFPPFDRYAHLQETAETTIQQKLLAFKTIRSSNLIRLKELIQHESQLELTGSHPEFGAVKAKELLSTWVVHDLTHTAQIVRIMAGRYSEDVGPWKAYLGILKKQLN